VAQIWVSGGGTDIHAPRSTLRSVARRACDRSQNFLSWCIQHFFQCILVVRHRHPEIRTRPAGHLSQNDTSNTRTSEVVRRVFAPTSRRPSTSSRRNRVFVIARHRRYTVRMHDIIILQISQTPSWFTFLFFFSI